MRKLTPLRQAHAFLLALLATLAAHAESATIAVAANFTTPAEALQALFEQGSDHRVAITSGSTGQLYAQITNGAPFDVLLSADREHVDMLVAADHADSALRFTYAVGKLALWTRDLEKFAPLDLASLSRSDYRWLAIANPELAPYGLAAEQTLRKLDLWDALQHRIVRGQSIAQTFAMAETRNADLAFVALSQVIAYRQPAAHVDVPADLYHPILQDAVLLAHGHDNAAARAFLTFLRAPEAIRVIEQFGYAVAEARAADPAH
jgi:molybdate transport system substrate-binding protein